MLTCVLLYGALCTTISATETTVADTSSTTEQNADVTLGSTEIVNLGKAISEAKGDNKAEDKRTPRDKLTAAYLASDLEAAKTAIKQANDALDPPVVINYDTLTLGDVKTLIDTMKTSVITDRDLGLFDSIMLAVGSMISWLTYTLGAGNYIVGILIFALIVELATLPLTFKQQKNTIKQAKLKPKEMAIRKKYAGREDQATKQKIATEIQEMYQKENFSPFSGCLPMLIQLPIIFILYNVVVNPILYVMKLSSGVSDALITFANTSAAAGGLGEASTNAMRGTIRIASLINENPDFLNKLGNFQYFSNSSDIVAAVQAAKLPNFDFFGLNFGLVPTLNFKPFDWLIFIPILTFVVYFASMKLTRKMTYQPTETDRAIGCSNNVMDIGMPLMSVYFCFIAPAVLGFYWVIKSVFGTLSRFVVSKIMPFPVFTEEDYKAAIAEYNNKSGKNSSRSIVSEYRSATGKPVRSLHHIDDEDYDDTREKALAKKAKLEEEERKASEAAEKNAAGVKNEDDRPMLTLKEMLGMRKKKNAPADNKKNDATGNGNDKKKQDKK